MGPIDPLHVTDYSRNQADLEQFWVFCVVVAGKNADQTAQKVSRLIAGRSARQTPLEYLHSLGVGLGDALVACRTGQYRRIGLALAGSFGLNLRTVPVAQLEQIHGVGPKTARFFVLHTRPLARVAVLDTHILKWLDRLGLEGIPRHTPGSSKQYAALEQRAIDLLEQTFPGMTLAEADLHVWATVSGRQ